MSPQAEAVPHPHIEGAWTLLDPLAQSSAHYLPLFASKITAEIAANKRNNQRRDK